MNIYQCTTRNHYLIVDIFRDIRVLLDCMYICTYNNKKEKRVSLSELMTVSSTGAANNYTQQVVEITKP